MGVMGEAEGCAQLALAMIMQRAIATAREVGAPPMEGSWVMCTCAASSALLQPTLAHKAASVRPPLSKDSASQAERLSQQLQRLERDLDAAKSSETSARAQAAWEAKRSALQAAEAEAAGANARSEHAQALGRLTAASKKLEVGLHPTYTIRLFRGADCASEVGSGVNRGKTL